MIKLKILHAAVCGVLFLGNAMTHAWAGPIGYLGPAGSWTHQACLDLFGASDLVPLLQDPVRLADMGRRAASVGVRDGSGRLVDLIESAARLH